MNSNLEKEKKLILALTKLKNLNLESKDNKNNVKILSSQKNQLEIEKAEIEKKYKTLVDEHDNLSKKINELHYREKIEEKKKIEFSEKIDELNQETNTLMDEMDKWQM
tara:strand:+ start:2193 stop:2516 length:324 start_codon:yes stop_codon:yes gene_type:complete